jgi:filamentous hemagglutinin
MEDRVVCLSIEEARNKAIAWLESLGAVFGPHHQIQIGRFGALGGKETGVESLGVHYWRIRLDYDPSKGAHFNVEFGKGPLRKKKAFSFPGGEALITKLAKSRNPR